MHQIPQQQVHQTVEHPQTTTLASPTGYPLTTNSPQATFSPVQQPNFNFTPTRRYQQQMHSNLTPARNHQQQQQSYTESYTYPHQQQR